MELTNGPIYKENQTCYDSVTCDDNGGRCMPWTSLEVAWTTCDDEFIAHTHPSMLDCFLSCFDNFILVGEVTAHWSKHKMYDKNETIVCQFVYNEGWQFHNGLWWTNNELPLGGSCCLHP